MASTTWAPMTRMEPRSWLLGTGEIVTEPALEMTTSGRKVRVAGTTESVYEKDTEDLLWHGVQALAQQKQTHVHLEVTQPLNAIIAMAAGYEPASTQAKLHLVHGSGDASAKTILWWRFKDSKTPFEVLLTAAMHTEGRRSNHAGVQKIQVSLTVPIRTYQPAMWEGKDTTATNVLNPSLSQLVEPISQLGYDHRVAWEEFIRDNPPAWDASLLGSDSHIHVRAGVAAFLRIIRDLDGMSTIQVPDFGDPDNPSYKTLDLYDTNYNEGVASDLAEYLDGAPTVEKALELYKEFLETLRGCGIVFDATVENDFQAALLSGDKASLGVRVFNLAETNHNVDNDHKLSVHLPTGTFVVECTHREVRKDDVAEKWDEALTMASLTGREDALLAYATAYAKEHAKTRTKTIIKERSQ